MTEVPYPKTDDLYCNVVDKLEEVKILANSFTGPVSRELTVSDLQDLGCLLYHTAAYAMAVTKPDSSRAEMQGILDEANRVLSRRTGS